MIIGDDIMLLGLNYIENLAFVFRRRFNVVDLADLAFNRQLFRFHLLAGLVLPIEALINLHCVSNVEDIPN